MARKNEKSQYAAYSFQERLKRAQWRDVIERCETLLWHLVVASGGVGINEPIIVSSSTIDTLYYNYT